MNLEDIPDIPDQEKRIAEVTVDCYGQYEELAAFYTYLDDVLQFPFARIWRDEDEPGHSEPVTVLGVDDIDDRRGVLLRVKRGEWERRVVAEQIWAQAEKSKNAIVLDDYRY